ncbi:MAG TPA: CoA transferase, partial [Candidatus Methylomirabilis sp.]|nr:CoA transferase [Candidatus Methylomirabilis sp.]
TQDTWENLARAIGREELIRDPRFLDLASRKQHAEELDREVQTWMAGRMTDEIVSTLEQHSIPCGPVLDIPALVRDPQFQVNETVVHVEYPGLGPVPVLVPPIRLSGDAMPRRGRPPRLGEHTQEVLSEWLGLGEADLQSLRVANAL